MFLAIALMDWVNKFYRRVILPSLLTTVNIWFTRRQNMVCPNTYFVSLKTWLLNQNRFISNVNELSNISCNLNKCVCVCERETEKKPIDLRVFVKHLKQMAWIDVKINNHWSNHDNAQTNSPHTRTNSTSF